jgi:hypothetical protein
MSAELADRIRGALLATDRALTSGEIAARLKAPMATVEATLDYLKTDPRLVVCEWPMTDPHFGVDRIVVAARTDPAAGDQATRSAEDRCKHVYDDILRDFLASHRCV